MPATLRTQRGARRLTLAVVMVVSSGWLWLPDGSWLTIGQSAALVAPAAVTKAAARTTVRGVRRRLPATDGSIPNISFVLAQVPERRHVRCCYRRPPWPI